MSRHDILKSVVKCLLEQAAFPHVPNLYDWETQGLGMLRRRLNSGVRLHIWHKDLVYANKPSEIHNHPWDFESVIVVGALRNHVYCKAAFGGESTNIGTIACGVGGGLVPDSVKQERLLLHNERTYREGDSYKQTSDIFHKTSFHDGTVTLVRRVFKPDTEHAQVAFPIDEEWKTAEPRPATSAEIQIAVKAALELF